MNFNICRRAAEAKGVQVLPLVTQADFLFRMGIIERVQRLISLEDTSEEQAAMLVDSIKMLMDPDAMGKKFKVMCIAHPTLASVPGFEHNQNQTPTP